MNLEALQVTFQSAILEGSDAATATIAQRGGIGTEERLDIYREAYGARLVDALRDLHGHTARFLGDDRFTEVALEYAAAHPSSARSLRDYGSGFSSWLRQRLPGEPAGDLAQLDLVLRNAFDGPDAPVLSLADLAKFPAGDWERAVLSFHPTVNRVRLPAGTLPLWQAIDQDREIPECHAVGQWVEILAWRCGLQPHFRSLGTFEATALDLLMKGESFGAACGQLSEMGEDQDAAQACGTLLRRWVDEALLSGVTASPGAQEPSA